MQVQDGVVGLKEACFEIMNSKDLDLLLSASLKLSNILDCGTQNANGFGIRLPSMLKLADIKASDKKTSLLKVILGQLAATSGPHEAKFLKRDMPHLQYAAGIQVRRRSLRLLNIIPG